MVVRRTLGSARDNSYYQNNDNQNETESTVAVAAATSNNVTPRATTKKTPRGTPKSNVEKAVAEVDAQQEYDQFMSTLDDRQKNAINVLDTWFQLKSSCVATLTEVEEGNTAIRDAVDRSKDSRLASEKQLGMKLGIGAASINYEISREDAKPLQDKIKKLQGELEKERAKYKKLKESSTSTLRARKKEIDMLRSKLKYCKKENEALTSKVALYKEALKESEKDVVAAERMAKEAMAKAASSTSDPSGTDPDEEVRDKVPASSFEDAEDRETDNETVVKSNRKSIKSRVDTRSSTQDEKRQNNDPPDDPPESKSQSKPEVEVDAVVDVDAAVDVDVDAAVDVDVDVDVDVYVEEEADSSELNFSDMLAMDLPEATSAPKPRKKFTVGSSGGAFGSIASPPRPPPVNTKKTLQAAAAQFEAGEDGYSEEREPMEFREENNEDEREASNGFHVDVNPPRRGSFAAAKQNFSKKSANVSPFPLRASSPASSFRKASPAASSPAAPSTYAAAPYRAAPSPTPALQTNPSIPSITAAPSEVSKTSDITNQMSQDDVAEEEFTSPPVKSKIASLAAAYGGSSSSSVRAMRMSFERPSSRATTPVPTEAPAVTVPASPFSSAIRTAPASPFTRKSTASVPPAESPAVKASPFGPRKSYGPPSSVKKIPLPPLTRNEPKQTTLAAASTDVEAPEPEEKEPMTTSITQEEVPAATPVTKAVAPPSPSYAAPGSAQKELEELRSMMRAKGGLANKKRFEVFEKKGEESEADDSKKYSFKPAWAK